MTSSRSEDVKAYISSYDEAEAAYKEGSLKIHDKVLYRRDGGRMETTLGRVLFNENVEQTLRDYLATPTSRRNTTSSTTC